MRDGYARRLRDGYATVTRRLRDGYALRSAGPRQVLDVRNLCTEKLQKSINAHCELLRKEEDAKNGIAPAKPEAAPSTAAASSSSGDAMDTTVRA